MRAPLAKTSQALLASRRGRWTFALLVALALGFLVLGRIEHPLVDRMRTAAADTARPLLELLVRPVERIDALIDWAASVTTLVSENARLRQENERLRSWRDAALALERENERLRTLLNAPALEQRPIATPRVVGVAGGPFVRTVLINAGRADGVKDDQPVIDERGLVGRVLDAGYKASRVLLITDLNSRIPVRLQRSGAPAIVRGRNDALLELAFLAPDTVVGTGESVVTTGDGGIFPPDILIGHVETVDGQAPTVRPAALFDRLDFVEVLPALADTLAVEPAAEGADGADP